MVDRTTYQPADEWPDAYAVGPPRQRFPLGVRLVVALAGAALLVVAVVWLLGESPVLAP